MSDTMREKVAGKLVFSNAEERDDLTRKRGDGSYVVHTNLVAALDHLQHHCPAPPAPILVTAMFSCHGDSRPGDPWSHKGCGAVDIWHSTWQQVGDGEILTVLKNLAINPYITDIGLAGVAQQYLGRFTVKPWISVWNDHGADHLHIETGAGAPYS